MMLRARWLSTQPTTKFHAPPIDAQLIQKAGVELIPHPLDWNQYSSGSRSVVALLSTSVMIQISTPVLSLQVKRMRDTSLRLRVCKSITSRIPLVYARRTRMLYSFTDP